MIRTYIEGCKWGMDPTEQGLTINLLHEESQHLWHLPFNNEALVQLVEFAWKYIPEDQRRRIQAESAGVIVAKANDLPNGNGRA